MKNLGRLLLRHWQLTSVYVLFAIAYILLTLLVAPAKTTLTKYQIGESQLRLLQVAVILPYIIIWMIGLVGYLRLHDYTAALGKSKDGRAFRVICLGVFYFVLWLPLAVLISSGVNAIDTYHPSLTADMVRVQNYLNLLVLAPAFIYTYLGAKKLLGSVRSLTPVVSLRTTLFFITFAAFYVFVTLEDTARRVAPDDATTASYYLADWLIVLTLVVPRLLTWYLGVQGVQFLRKYRRKVPGVIYRAALQRLAYGIAITVLMIILLRLLQSLMNPLSRLSLGVLFLVVYLLLAGLAVGYILIAKGARQLQSIEEA